MVQDTLIALVNELYRQRPHKAISSSCSSVVSSLEAKVTTLRSQFTVMVSRHGFMRHQHTV